jgi:hypothetical protein
MIAAVHRSVVGNCTSPESRQYICRFAIIFNNPTFPLIKSRIKRALESPNRSSSPLWAKSPISTILPPKTTSI